MPHSKLRGVLVAAVTPFTDDLALDEADLRQHLARVAAVPGITGIVCNAHAAEVETLDRDERRRCLALARETAPDKTVVAGIRASSTANAVAYARDAVAEGADALLVCAPSIPAWRAADAPEFAVAFHKAIADAVDLPMIPFQYPQENVVSYPHEALLQMVDEIPSVAGVKMCHGGELRRYEQDLRALQAHPRDIAILPALAQYFLPYAALGGVDGALTGFGNVAPEWVVATLAAVQAGDLARAQALHARLYPVTSIVCQAPGVYLHVRYKEAAYLAGRIRGRAVRPPQLPLPAAEQAALVRAMAQAELLAREPALA
ncbi:MAG TPA: dihydrodipicolinate synthase family protein [Chloroflexota bacterium]|nr:dihydrodipicolinate synthase family protein [Chloroflexota bacterium]